MSFVPVPEIILDPNEGNTYGLMGVWMFLDENSEIQYMVAPDIRYNVTKGVFPVFRLFGYPTPTRRYKIAIGQVDDQGRDYEAEYYDRGLLEGHAFLRAKALFEHDSTERFFGFGNTLAMSRTRRTTPAGPSTPGSSPDTGSCRRSTSPIACASAASALARAGERRAVPHRAAATGCATPRPNTVESWLMRPLPGHYFSNRIEFGYDTRDSIDLPTQGALSRVYVDMADRALGSSTSYTKFGVRRARLRAAARREEEPDPRDACDGSTT